MRFILYYLKNLGGVFVWFAPTSVGSVREGLEIVQEAIGRTGYNDRIKIGIDVAATDFCIGIYSHN